MNLSRRLLMTAMIANVACLGTTKRFSAVAAASNDLQAGPTATPVQVYLLRGLADVFSRGMDTLAGKLNRLGYSAYAYNHTHAPAIFKHIAGEYARGRKAILVLIGHSLGANAAVQIANELAPLNVPVELVVTFDATKPLQAPKNVLHFVNFFQHNGVGKQITPGPGFQGELSNYDLTTDRSLSHITIEKSDRLHSHVLGKIGYIVEKDLVAKAPPPKESKAKKARSRDK